MRSAAVVESGTGGTSLVAAGVSAATATSAGKESSWLRSAALMVVRERQSAAAVIDVLSTSPTPAGGGAITPPPLKIVTQSSPGWLVGVSATGNAWFMYCVQLNTERGSETCEINTIKGQLHKRHLNLSYTYSICA